MDESSGSRVETRNINKKQIKISEITIVNTKENIFQKGEANSWKI